MTTSPQVDAAANEASLRYLASELQRVHLLAAQHVGNIALLSRMNAEKDAEIAQLKNLSESPRD